MTKPALLRPALVAASLFALAAPVRAETVWLCGLSEELTRLVCVADVGEPSADRDPAPARAESVRVRGNEYPLDPHREWTINFYSVPNDLDDVEKLASATICHRSQQCSVIMGGLATLAQRNAPMWLARGTSRRF